MNYFFYHLHHFFPFRSKTNFLITFCSITGTSYFYVRYTTDRKFEHPSVKESLRLLNCNKQIIEMLGYPVDIITGITKSRAEITEKMNFYEFTVKGPRGGVKIAMATDGKRQSELKTGELCKQYYIPDNDLREFLENTKNSGGLDRLQTTEIPEDKKFWRISSLVVNISAEYKLPIVEDVQNRENLEKAVTSENAEKVQQPEKIEKTLGNARKFLIEIANEEKERLGKQDIFYPKSEEEIEEMRKFKLSQTYRKIGYVRTYMLGVGMLGAMLIYIYIRKNKRLRIEGSDIQFLTQQYVKSNYLIQNKYGANLRFIPTTRGAIIDKYAEFEQDFLTNKGTLATVFSKGVKDERTQQWKFESIKVGSKNRKGEISDIQILI